jgi:hypothetical protein
VPAVGTLAMGKGGIDVPPSKDGQLAGFQAHSDVCHRGRAGSGNGHRPGPVRGMLKDAPLQSLRIYVCEDVDDAGGSGLWWDLHCWRG